MIDVFVFFRRFRHITYYRLNAHTFQPASTIIRALVVVFTYHAVSGMPIFIAIFSVLRALKQISIVPVPYISIVGFVTKCTLTRTVVV